MRAKSLQSCLNLYDSIDYGPPGSLVHGILQARILEWVVMPSSRDLPNPGIKPRSHTLQAICLLHNEGFFGHFTKRQLERSEMTSGGGKTIKISYSFETEQ